MSAVCCVTAVAAFGSAPRDSSASTMSALPVRAAIISGVRPLS